MGNKELLVAGFGIFLFAVYAWAFRALPGERWQIMASIPVKKKSGEIWEGINLTYYGFFTATAFMLSMIMFLFLSASLDISAVIIIIIVLCVVIASMPFSKIIARLVERKQYGITIGGASFVGFIITPWIIGAASQVTIDMTGMELPAVPLISILIIVYAFGEGFGRLACISFGCCYGKPISKFPPVLRKYFNKIGFTFVGNIKKISYADNLGGTKVFPVQAVTAVLFTSAGLAGIYQFLNEYYFSAAVSTMVITQLWRFISEFFRADYRGQGKISVYQFMSLLIIPYMIIAMILFPAQQSLVPDIMRGMGILQHPAIILFIILTWLCVFFYTGVSKTTEATITFSVNRNRI